MATIRRMTAKIGGDEVECKDRRAGPPLVQNMLAVLGAAYLVGADLDKVTPALATLSAEKRPRQAPPAAASRRVDRADRRKLQRQSGIDEGRARTAWRNAGHGGGRRIAVLGDMLELGEHSRRSFMPGWRN